MDATYRSYSILTRVSGVLVGPKSDTSPWGGDLGKGRF